MGNIWYRKSFEIGGHCPCGGDEKTRMTPQNRQSLTRKKRKKKWKSFLLFIQCNNLKYIFQNVL